ncbi:MAG: branched-chain amino acid ABC transporter permease [Burkholderiales bacterium]|nr:branched-chain amino acid ABC transporter permease [Burkholderiales bacterium]
MQDSDRLIRWLIVLGAVCLALFPLAGSTFYLQLLTKIMIMAIFAMSLDLIVGYTGLVSLGQSAYFGFAAYMLALASPKGAAASLWLTLPGALAATAALSLAIGLLVLRTAGIYFIMVTLAFAQMLYYLFHDTGLGGGSDGIYIHVRPSLALGDFNPVNLADHTHFYYLVFALMLGAYLLLRAVIASPFGRVLVAIRENPVRVRSLGFQVFNYKLGAFVLAGTLAGLAGYLSACQFGFVNPEILSWHYSGIVLMMLLLGGMGRLYGAVIGAFAFILVQELFSLEALFGDFARRWQLSMGVFIVLVVLLLPRGLSDLVERLGRGAAKRAAG